MTTREESRPLVAQEAGQDGMATGKAHNSYYHSTSGGADSQWQISALLMKGEENAIPGQELARMADVNPRKLRIMVDQERLKRPICASDRGYFLPDDGSKGIFELRKFLRRQDSRCAANRRVTRSARAALRALENAPLEGQETFFGRGDD